MQEMRSLLLTQRYSVTAAAYLYVCGRGCSIKTLKEPTPTRSTIYWFVLLAANRVSAVPVAIYFFLAGAAAAAAVNVRSGENSSSSSSSSSTCRRFVVPADEGERPLRNSGQGARLIGDKSHRRGGLGSAFLAEFTLDAIISVARASGEGSGADRSMTELSSACGGGVTLLLIAMLLLLLAANTPLERQTRLALGQWRSEGAAITGRNRGCDESTRQPAHRLPCTYLQQHVCPALQPEVNRASCLLQRGV
jgi:hypothetical protein